MTAGTALPSELTRLHHPPPGWCGGSTLVRIDRDIWTAMTDGDGPHLAQRLLRDLTPHTGIDPFPTSNTGIHHTDRISGINPPHATPAAHDDTRSLGWSRHPRYAGIDPRH